jgi:prepilin peptidase CpaA
MLKTLRVVMAYSLASIVFFIAALAIAAVLDVTTRRIPNWITVPLLGTGLAAQASTAGPRGCALALVAAVALLAVLVPLWRRGFLGGGDLKLGVAAAAWVGLARTPRYLVAAALFGGALALLSYARAGLKARQAIRANLLQLHVPSWAAAAQAHGVGALVPYGAAFAAGALYAVLS